VVFLQMPVPAPRAPEVFPPGAELARQRLSVAGYRKIYDAIGGPWLWWLRRVMPDEMLAQHLANPAVSTHLLRVDGEMAGFFELERNWPDVNLNYFGLMQDRIGQGLGTRLLRSAINEVALINQPSRNGGGPARRFTVNTCSADHPRALPNYLAEGFLEIRRAREIWDIPRRLGFAIPDRLRA
jgi:GNAT superfamily N-acetyltransferase